jgi:hypothetical protein
MGILNSITEGGDYARGLVSYMACLMPELAPAPGSDATSVRTSFWNQCVTQRALPPAHRHPACAREDFDTVMSAILDGELPR